MISGKKLQELSDTMKRQYLAKEIDAQEVVTVLLSLKLANQITGPTMRIIAEEIVTDEKELAGAIVFAITISKDKTVMKSLIKNSRIYGESE